MHFLKIMLLKHFLEDHRFTEICIGITLTGKVSPKFMSTNAGSVDSNLHAMSMFGLISKNYQFLAKPICFKKMAYGLRQDNSCIKILIVNDFEALFK